MLTQTAVTEKSNEIKAIPEVLAQLELQGALVSIDAMGCQKEIVRQIVDAEADYVLALKNNHPILYNEAKLWIDAEVQQGRLPVNETIN